MVRKFSAESDLSTINQWARGNEIRSEFLPSNGFINDSAVVFVYKTDSVICYLEQLIADPNSPREERSSAINQVVRAAIQWARNNDFKLMFSTTVNPSVISRAHEFGFKSSHHTFLKLSL